MTVADPPCAVCCAWIARLGHAIGDDLVAIATDRGITVPQARALLLAAYHDHHTTQEEPWT